MLVVCKLESFLYELHIKSTPLVMHEKLLKEVDTALKHVPCFMDKTLRLFAFQKCTMCHVLTLLALTDTK